MSYNPRIDIKVLEAFVTVLFIGHIKPAPGTWGSLIGVLLMIVVFLNGDPYLYFCIIVFLGLLGTIAIHLSTKEIDHKDRKEIIIDEVVGQSITLFPVSLMAYTYELNLNDLWLFILLGFLCFRFFDIIKLGPIKQADMRNDAIGVMLDDIYAGILSAFLLIILMVLTYVY